MLAPRFNDSIQVGYNTTLPQEVVLPSNPATGFAYFGTVFADYQPPWQPGSAFSADGVLPYTAAAGFFYTVYINGGCIGTFTETGMLTNVLLNAGETLTVVVSGNNVFNFVGVTLRFSGYVLTTDQVPLPAPLPFTSASTQFSQPVNPGINNYSAEQNIKAGSLNGSASAQAITVLDPTVYGAGMDLSLTHLQLELSVLNPAATETRYDTYMSVSATTVLRNEIVTYNGVQTAVMALGPLIQPLPLNDAQVVLNLPAQGVLSVTVTYLLVFLLSNASTGLPLTSY